MPFHRLTIPSYFGGLPGGYDYINNAASGTPANADGAKASGTNIGSYFVTTQEDATSLAFNRPAKALAQNTDYLDDLLRRDLASPVVTADVTAGATVTSIVLTGPGIFLGEAGTANTVAGIRTFVRLTDNNDLEMLDSTGAEIQVTAISDTVGGGFSASNVTLTISPGIPTGRTYRVYYGVRGNLASYSNGFLSKARPINTSLQQRLLDRTRTITAAATLHSPLRDGTVIINPSSAFNLQLPNPALYAGQKVFLINGNGTINTTTTVTLVRAGTEKINGVAASYALNVTNGAWWLTTDGTDWYVVSALAVPPTQSTLTTAGSLTVSARENIVFLNTSGGAFNLQLPNPATAIAGQYWRLKDINGTFDVSNVTLVRFGTEKIEGVAANYALSAAWGAYELRTNGTDWFFT